MYYEPRRGTPPGCDVIEAVMPSSETSLPVIGVGYIDIRVRVEA